MKGAAVCVEYRQGTSGNYQKTLEYFVVVLVAFSRMVWPTAVGVNTFISRLKITILTRT